MSNKKISSLIATSLLTLLLGSGCNTANPHFYQKSDLSTNKPTAITMDAKKRTVISMPYRPQDKDWISIRFCAEPSPDVFTAIASSFGAAIDADADSKSKGASIGASFAKTLNENAATIERTQTINILRESMYRTCERYLSGAIRWKELVVQAARDQRMMVAVLAIEQLTGVARAQSTALTTALKTHAATGDSASLKILSDAKAAKKAAETQLNESVQTALSTEPKDTTCEKFGKLETPENETPEQKATRELKESSCQKVTLAEKALAQADEYYNTVLKLAEKQTTILNDAEGELHTASLTMAAANEHIAEKVVEIVENANAFDEVLMTCVAAFRETSAGEEPQEEKETAQSSSTNNKQTDSLKQKERSLKENCMELVRTMVTARISDLNKSNK